MFIQGTYTGGDYIYIIYRNGSHSVYRELAECYPEDELLFRGHYEKCLDYVQKLVEANVDYDHNL